MVLFLTATAAGSPRDNVARFQSTSDPGSTYYVQSAGADVGDCRLEAAACATVQYAIEQHRLSPQPNDVIDVGPGTFVGNVDATEPEDTGLVIRGTLSEGDRLTTLRGTDEGGPFFSAVSLGTCGADGVTLRDVVVDTEGAELETSAIVINGDSLLSNAAVSNQPGSTATEVVYSCGGSPTIEDSAILAEDQVEGLIVEHGLTLRDSVVVAEDGVAVGQAAIFGGGKMTIERSRLAAAEASPTGVLMAAGDLVLDSSLLTGGFAGVVLGDGDEWAVLNSTIDSGEPGFDSEFSVLATPFDPSPAELTINSSVLVEEVGAAAGEGTATCTYSDLPGASTTSGAEWDLECEAGQNGNAATSPEELFKGDTIGDFSWELLPDAPAIDAGDPSAIPGVGASDLSGNPRVAIGKASSCPTARRDMGAYEFADLECDEASPTAPTNPPTVPADRSLTASGFETWFSGNRTRGQQSKPRTGKTRTMRFEFTAGGDVAIAGFECRLDRQPFRPCASPQVYRRMKLGMHTFQVRAVDAAGNVDPTPATKRFRIPYRVR